MKNTYKKAFTTRGQHSIDMISDAEWQDAIENLVRFLKWRLRNKTCGGAFSEEALGMQAVDYYRSETCSKLLNGEWHWHQNKTLTRQLIVIASSLISKRVKQFERMPEIVNIDTLGNEPATDNEEDIVEIAYQIAFDRVKGCEELEVYLGAVREYNNFEEIRRHLGLTIGEVYRLQRKLIRRVRCKNK